MSKPLGSAGEKPVTARASRAAEFGRRHWPDSAEESPPAAADPQCARDYEAINSVLVHELAQPLTAAANFVESSARLVRQQILELERLLTLIECARTQTTRAGQVFHRIREFDKNRRINLETEDLNAIIAAAVASLPEGEVELARSLPTQPLHARVDGVLIGQVLTNLLTNAAEAMAGSPVRRIGIEARQLGDQAMIRIRDTGPGFARDSAERSFEQGVTTKPGSGGLGLTICRSIVDAHGGKLWAERPVEGSGAVINLILPTGLAPRT